MSTSFLSSSAPFAVARARRTERGAIQWDDSAGFSVEDVYHVVMADGTPPVGFPIRCKGEPNISRNIDGDFPARNSSHPEYGKHFAAKSVRWERVGEKATVWRAVVSYLWQRSALASDADGTVTGVLGVEFYSNSITAPVNLLNSAGEPVVPAPSREIASPCLRIRLRSKRAPSYMMRFMGVVNSEEITICGIFFPPYTARCMFTVSSVEEEETGDGETSVVKGLYDYTLDIQGNFTPAPDSGEFADGTAFADVFGRAIDNERFPLLSGWVQLIPDAGYCYKANAEDGSAFLVRFKVAASEDPTALQDSPEPKFLDGAGKELPAAAPVKYYGVRAGHAVDFGPLALPEEW